MSESRFGDVSGYFKRLKRAAVSATASASTSDAHAATLERLERELADEREKAAALQRTSDNLTFQMEVLEKGYAKQLEAARERADEAEGLLAKRDDELIELTVRHEAATESLAATKEDLERVTTQRDRLRRQIDGDPEPDEMEDAGAGIPEGTINRLMAVASRPRGKRRTADELSPMEAGKDEAGSDELLPPELLLRKKEVDES